MEEFMQFILEAWEELNKKILLIPKLRRTFQNPRSDAKDIRLTA